MSNKAIAVEGLGKRFYIGAQQQRGYRTFREALTSAMAVPVKRAASLLRGHATGAADLHEELWAVRELSFDVAPGEVVGVIGKNGAGKTTPLKLLSRITEPTEGRALIRGRVGSLLEVGTGFHPELTGRENIFLNGAILGMSRSEIGAKFDEIVEFSEVGKFIDTPVKHYSSGMYVRLAFSVAAHLEPEILIVDEVLSVGDASFQRKCVGKMGQVAQGGRTVLFVSHNMSAVTQLCTRAILLRDGTVFEDGDPTDVVRLYLSQGLERSAEWQRGEEPSVDGFAFEQIRVLDASGLPTRMVGYGEETEVELTYRLDRPIKACSVATSLADQLGNVLWVTQDTDRDTEDAISRGPGRYRAVCRIPARLLRPGRYFVSAGAHVRGVQVLEALENVLAFDVAESGWPVGAARQGLLSPSLEWRTRPLEGPDGEDQGELSDSSSSESLEGRLV